MKWRIVALVAYALFANCAALAVQMSQLNAPNENYCLSIEQFNGENYEATEVEDLYGVYLNLKVIINNSCHRNVLIDSYEIMYENITCNNESPSAVVIVDSGYSWVSIEEPEIARNSFSLKMTSNKTCSSTGDCNFEALTPSLSKVVELNVFGQCLPEKWKVGSVYLKDKSDSVPIKLSLTNLLLDPKFNVNAVLLDISNSPSNFEYRFQFNRSNPEHTVNVRNNSKYQLQVQGYVVMMRRICFKQLETQFDVVGSGEFEFAYEPYYFMKRSITLKFEHIMMSGARPFNLYFSSENYVFEKMLISYYNQVVKVPDISEPIQVEIKESSINHHLALKTTQNTITEDTFELSFSKKNVSVMYYEDIFNTSPSYYDKANILIGANNSYKSDFKYISKAYIMIDGLSKSFSTAELNVKTLKVISPNQKIMIRQEYTLRNGLGEDRGLINLILDLNLAGVILDIKRPSCGNIGYLKPSCPEDSQIIALIQSYRYFLPDKIIAIEIASGSIFGSKEIPSSLSTDKTSQATMIEPLLKLISKIDEIHINNSDDSIPLTSTYETLRSTYKFTKNIFYWAKDIDSLYLKPVADNDINVNFWKNIKDYSRVDCELYFDCKP